MPHLLLKADRKKFLKGDGTWAETTAEYTIDDVDIMDPSVSSVTLSSGTWGNVFADFQTGAKNVHIMCYWHNDPHWNPNYCFYSVVDTIEDQTAYGVYVDKLVLAAPDGGVVLVTLPTPDSATAAVTHITPITSLPTANATTAGIAKLYTTTGQNTDGSVTQKLFTDTVGNIESALQILNSGAGVP